MEEIIEELTKVEPEKLSKEGRRLFDFIMDILDEQEEMEDRIAELENKLNNR